MTRLAVNGVHLNITVTGDGPPLVLLHGFTGSNATWQTHQPALAQHYRLIAIEMLGHGESDAPSDPTRYSLEHTVADLTAILDVLKLEKAALLGYSMGGRIALHFAVNRPDRVSALLLESSSPGLATIEERAARVASDHALADFIEREGLAAFVERWENLPLFASQHRLPAEVQTALHRQRLTNRPSGLANSLRGAGTGAQPSLWSQLNRLTMPVLLIVGELDPKFTQIAHQMREILPHAQLEIIPTAGHTPHLEAPAPFDQLILNFLRSKAIQPSAISHQSSASDFHPSSFILHPSSLIIVSGPPGVGKTVLSRRLAAELNLPILSKDSIKERLFDSLGWKDREWSKKLGFATYELLFYCLETHLQGGHNLILESNFNSEVVSPRFQALKRHYNFETFQIMCYADGPTLLERFKRRWEAGKRHPGHVDHETYTTLEPQLLKGRAEPLDIGGTIYELDMTDFEKIDYQALFKALSET
jgi:2-succinyl-6-hydroxy-2,4-cyclohexadiene-1-carboxylate synthase